MIVRAQVAIGADSPDVRDRFVVTPHFNVSEAAGLLQDDWDGLAMDLVSVFVNFTQQVREVNVRLYDAQANAPNYPLASQTQHANAYPVSSAPRELAVCLSYRGDHNAPRERGRIYIPAVLTGITTSTLRPSPGMMDKVLTLADGLTGLGGVNVDHGVFSRTSNQFHAGKHYWVDNEWDIIRSRGLRPTARVSVDKNG